jgi:nitrogen fixation/metabolism regulation signal transduction histidine kinase
MLVGKEDRDDVETASAADSQEDLRISFTFPPDIKIKSSPSALHMISTETMKRTAHRKMVRRLFAVELFFWALIYVLLALWASSLLN